MSERPIPEDIWEVARGLRNAVNWQSNGSVEIIARALMARDERCAQIAEGDSASFDFDAALAECRDLTVGLHSGRLAAAADIRRARQ